MVVKTQSTAGCNNNTMVQSSAPLQSPAGKADEGKNELNIKMQTDGELPHKPNGAAMIIEPINGGGIPLQKINSTITDDNNNPPLLQSSADGIVEDVAVENKPSSSGEAHVERSALQDINNSSTDTATVRSDAATAVIAKEANNTGGLPPNPLAASNLLHSPAIEDYGGKNDGTVLLDPRQQQILSSINHRRQLLTWVRESRIACEQSRSNISNGTKKGFVEVLLEEQLAKEKGDGSNGNDKQKIASSSSSSSAVGGITTTTAPISSAEEIANYQKATKFANSATQLQRKKSNTHTTTTAETAAQRDLRRGSSVGKRMSAAVTTLNNFGNVGGWASTDTSVSGDVTLSSSAAGSAKAPNHVSSSSTAAANNGKLLPTKANLSSSVKKQLDSAALQSSSSATTKVAAEKLSKKARKRASNIKKTGGSSSNADGSSNGGTAVSKNATAAKSTDKPAQYLTLSASAIRLRDRRDELALKLSNLLQKQHCSSSSGQKRKADIDETSPFAPRKPTKVAKTKVSQSSLTKLSSLSEMGKSKQATRLPPRRMTQWDCVLEEMRWMASDFIEERKWKVACGKSLSSAVHQQHIEEQKLLAAAKSAKGKSKGTPSKLNDASSANGTPTKPISPAKSNKSIDSKSSDRRKMSIDSNPLYVDPSTDDVHHARNISQLLSLTISDHWDVASTKGAFPLTDDCYKSGYERFQKVKGELLGETGKISARSSCAADDLPPPSPPPTFQQLEFEDISTKMQESLETINSLKEETEEILSKERALQKYRKSLKCGVELSNAQLKAVHFIESVWGKREEMSVAAVLGGDLGIGKTIVGCSTLWKNRHAGAQLVLCSPASLVSLACGWTFVTCLC